MSEADILRELAEIGRDVAYLKSFDIPKNRIESGWLLSPDIAVYASATSFTISRAKDLSARLPAGTPIMLRQPTAGLKFFYVVSNTYVAPTNTVVITGGSSYSLANEAIIDLYFGTGKWEGHPVWMSFTPTWASAANPQPALGTGTIGMKFLMEKEKVTLIFKLTIGNTTTLGTGNWSFTLPISVHAGDGMDYYGTGIFRRPGNYNYPFMVKLGAGDTVLQYFIPSNVGGLPDVNTLSPVLPVAWAANDYISCQIVYRP